MVVLWPPLRTSPQCPSVPAYADRRVTIYRLTPSGIDRFVMHTRALGVRAQPELIETMIADLWPTLGHMQPEAAAQAEYEE